MKKLPRLSTACCAIFLLLGGGLADQALAKIVTVVISGTASGYLDGPEGADYANEPFTWTVTYDTSNVVNASGLPIYLNPTSTITIQGNQIGVTQEHGFWVADTSGWLPADQKLWFGVTYMNGTDKGLDVLNIEGQAPWNGISTPYSSQIGSLSSWMQADLLTDHGQLVLSIIDGDTITSVTATSSDYTFSDWSGGATLTNALLLKYAIGGAASPSSASEQTSVTSDGSTLSLTAVIRTDNSQLTISGEAVDTLAGTWGTAGVSSVLAASQEGVPSGCERRVYSVSMTGAKKFLRIRATLAP